MANYVIRKNGVIIAYGEANTDNFNAGYPDGFSWEDYAPPSVPQRLLTKLEYMDRFTDSELEEIYTAAKSSVAVEVWLEKFKQATDINLDDERTVAGLNKLKDAGILTAQRVAEILS